MNGSTIQEAVITAVGVRNRSFARLNTSKPAWEMFLISLQQYGIASTSNNEIEALIQSLEGRVPMDVWDQTWKLFMAAYGTDAFRAFSEMAADLVNCVDDKNCGKTGNQAMFVSLPTWIMEWMGEMLKK